MSTRTLSRALGAALLALSVVGVAAPAQAIPLNGKSTQASFTVMLTDCSPTAPAGVACRKFALSGNTFTATGLAPEAEFGVQAFAATTVGDGTTTDVPVAVSPASTIAKITITDKGKRATIDATATLVCLADGCGIDGTHRFRLTLRRTTGSAYAFSSESERLFTGSCPFTDLGERSIVENADGKGTVTANGSTKRLRVYRPEGDENRFGRQAASNKAPNDCVEATSVVAGATSTAASGGPFAPSAVVTTKSTASEREVRLVVSNCPTTVGANCLAFELNGVTQTMTGEPTLAQFSATAYTAVTQAGGELDLAEISSTNKTPTGRITLDSTGRRGVLSTTLDFICSTPGCAVSGPWSFRISIKPGTSSVAIRVDEETITDDGVSCARSTVVHSLRHSRFAGSGWARPAGGSKLAMRVAESFGKSNRIEDDFARSTQGPGVCPV